MVEGSIKKELTEKEYRKLDYLSSSDLRLFNTDKKRFYKEKILLENRVEEYSKSLIIGSAVHCLLLEPQEFDNKFMLATCENPPTGMVLTFTESLYRQAIASMNEEGEVTGNLEEMLKNAYVESGFKITFEAAIKKFKDTGKDYYEQMLRAKANGLEILCMTDVNIANRIVEIVKADEFVGHYFKDIDFCELKVEGFEVDGVEMKAMLDKLVISHEYETIQLIDLKVVFDVPNFRREYYLKRQAYIQAYIYQQAIKSGKLDLGFDYSKYILLSPVFLAIDSGCYYQPIRYDVGVKGLEMAYNGFTENGREYPGVKSTLEELSWAIKSNIWTISKRAYDNKGIINLE